MNAVSKSLRLNMNFWSREILYLSDEDFKFGVLESPRERLNFTTPNSILSYMLDIKYILRALIPQKSGLTHYIS